MSIAVSTTRKPTAKQLTQLQAERDARIAKIQKIARLIAYTVILTALAAIGFTGSWQQLRDLGVLAGQSAHYWWSDANLTPLSVDLMLIIASIQHRRKGLTFIARLIARICSLGGLLVSLAGNVLVAWLKLPADVGDLQTAYTLGWAAVPVLSLLGAIEMLTHTHKDRPTLTRAKAKPSNAETEQAPGPRFWGWFGARDAVA